MSIKYFFRQVVEYESPSTFEWCYLPKMPFSSSSWNGNCGPRSHGYKYSLPGRSCSHVIRSKQLTLFAQVRKQQFCRKYLGKLSSWCKIMHITVLHKIQKKQSTGRNEIFIKCSLHMFLTSSIFESWKVARIRRNFAVDFLCSVIDL